MSIQVFPIHRRLALVRHTAETGVAMPNNFRRARYWRQRIDYFRAMMLKAGMAPTEVEQELHRFRLAVKGQSELIRRGHLDLPPLPTGSSSVVEITDEAHR